MQSRPQARLTDFNNFFVGWKVFAPVSQIYLTFCQKFKMAAVRGVTWIFPFWALNAIGNTRKLTQFTPLYFYNVEC